MRVEQPLAWRIFPFVLRAEVQREGIAFPGVLRLVRQLLDAGLWWIRVRFRMVNTQPPPGSCPNPPALVFINGANAGAGQSFFSAVFDPGLLHETRQAAVAGHPKAAVARPDQALNPIEPPPHFRPGPAIELPDSIVRRAPKPPIRLFREAAGALRTGFVGGYERPPFFIVAPSQAALGAEPQVAILRGERTGNIASEGRIGRWVWERIEPGAIVHFQIELVFGSIGIEALDAQPPVCQ